MQLRAGKTADNPAGRPLGAIAREIRLEIEVQVGRRQAASCSAPTAGVALGLQAIGLLLQLEGIDQLMRAQGSAVEIESPCLPAIRRPMVTR